MSDQKMREEFEAWHCESDEGPQTDPQWMIFNEETNSYALDKIQRDWMVWQASRAALGVELYWHAPPGSGLRRCVPDATYRKFSPSIRARYSPVMVVQELKP